MSALDLDLLRSWEGRQETIDDVVALGPVRALAATLDHDPAEYVEGGILPPLYHWLYCHEPIRFSDLAADGHAEKGGFMPPVPFPRRMFAGARVDYRGDLRIGDRLQRVSRIETVRYTEGRSGPLVFVTVTHELSNDAGSQLTEAQDIVYRPASAMKARPPAREATLPEADWCREIEPDERLLFRFSALTFNAHRIHYDLPYARSEGYPALVVHGPLTAMLLANLAVHECDRPELQHFEFRAKNAFCLGERISLIGKRVTDTIELTAVNDKGVAGLSARAVLRSPC